jgi:hypothetical protein
MADILSDNRILIDEIMRLAEDAVKFHGAMSGSGEPEPSEAFVQNFVAIKLHRKHSLTVTLETGKLSFCKYIDNSLWDDHDQLGLNNYKLDMVVWDDRPRALIEFKQSMDILSDLDRTAALLSVMSSTSVGYIVLCVVFDKRGYPTPDERYKLEYQAVLKEKSALFRDGELLVRSPIPIFRDDDGSRCGVIAIKVKPRPSIGAQAAIVASHSVRTKG